MTIINFIFEATVVSSNDIQDIEPEGISSSNWLPTFSFQSALQSSVQAKFTCIGVRFLQKHYANFEHRFLFGKPNYPFCTYRIRIQIRKVISWKFCDKIKTKLLRHKIAVSLMRVVALAFFDKHKYKYNYRASQKSHSLNCWTIWETRLVAHYGRIQPANRQWKCLVQKFRKWLFLGHPVQCTWIRRQKQVETSQARDCYFTDESKLAFYDKYTFTNCRRETGLSTQLKPRWKPIIFKISQLL